MVSLRFARETKPASTVICVRAEVRFVLRAVVYFRLTRFRSDVCLARNLITVFFFVNNPLRLFSTGTAPFVAPRHAVAGVVRGTGTACVGVARMGRIARKHHDLGTLRNSHRRTRRLARRCATRPRHVPEGAATRLERPRRSVKKSCPMARRNKRDWHEMREVRGVAGNESGRARRPDRGAATRAADVGTRRQWSSSSSSSA